MEGISKLAKMLASDDLKKRKRGHQYVVDLLSLKPGSDVDELSYADVISLCKGLYYSLWMQDKLLLQEDTVARILKCISHISTRKVRVMYITALFETLAREWENLDVWRTDKFMMLTRDLFTKSLALAQKRFIPIQALTVAVFDKVLNTDHNNAVDLKIFMISVLQQELVRKNAIAAILHKFYQCTLDTYLNIPKGSNYSTHMIKLCLTLSRMLKSHHQLPLQEMSETALVLSTTTPLHKKTLRRLSEILHVKTKKVGDEKSKDDKLVNGELKKTSNSLKNDTNPLNPTLVKEDSEIVAKPSTPMSARAKKRERKRRRSSSDSLNESSITSHHTVTSPAGNDEALENTHETISTPNSFSKKHHKRKRSDSNETNRIMTPHPLTPKENGDASEMTELSSTPLSVSTKKRHRKRRLSEESGVCLNAMAVTESGDAEPTSSTTKKHVAISDELATPSSASSKNHKRRRSQGMEDIDASTDTSLYVTAREEHSLPYVNTDTCAINTPTENSIDEVNKTPILSVKQKKKKRRSIDAADVSREVSPSTTPSVEKKLREKIITPTQPFSPSSKSVTLTPTETPALSESNGKKNANASPAIQILISKEQNTKLSNPSTTVVSPKKTARSDTTIPLTPIHKLSVPDVEASSMGRKRKSSGSEKLSNASFDAIEAAAKKRVSFGKVFRKKFSAHKLLTFTPTLNEKPDRGILRQL